MSCEINTRFKNITNYGDPTLTTEIEVNLKHWFDWAFVNIGAWSDVNGETEGIYGGRLDKLEAQTSKIFKGIRKDWLYEDIDFIGNNLPIDNISYSGGDLVVQLTNDTNEIFVGQEVRIFENAYTTGAYNVDNIISADTFSISGSFASGVAASGGYVQNIYTPIVPTVYDENDQAHTGYNIDYPNGRVIFDSAPTGDVYASYSFRSVQTYIGNFANFSLEVQKDSFNTDNLSWSNGAISGDFGSDPISRVQLPAIIIESIPKKTASGYELGSSAMRINQDISLKVIAQTKVERDFISDILCEQKEKGLTLYDIDLVNSANATPLTHEGYKNSGGQSYEEIVNNEDFFYRKAYIKNTGLATVQTNTPDLHISEIIYTVEVIK